MTGGVNILDNMRVVEVFRNMADSIAEKPLPSIPPPQRLPRRWVIGGIGATVATGIAAVVGIDKIQKAWQNLARTPEQAAAAEKFDKTPVEQRISNLVVGTDGAILRSTPNSNERDNIVGQLDPGSSVAEAIEVEGNNPSLPDSRHFQTKDIWYFTPKVVDSQGRVRRNAFSYSGNFNKPNQNASK